MLELLSDPYQDASRKSGEGDWFAWGFKQRPPNDRNIISHAADDDYVCCFDGHVYSKGATPPNDIRATNNAAWLIERYSVKREWSFLREVNGEFAGVLVERQQRAVHLFCDHFGIKRLYYWNQGEGLFWSSEVKAFLGAPDFEPELTPAALPTFLAYGVIGGTQTWFRSVALLPSATVLTWRNGDLASTRYGIDESDQPVHEGVGFAEAVGKVGELFQGAVERRARGVEVVGVRLSGGLDSRAVLAAAARCTGKVLHTFTFGTRSAGDVKIARRVARKARAVHHEFQFDNANWFDNRAEAVWISDGQLGIYHMHGVPDMYGYREIDAHLSGVLGGGVIGGLFQRSWPAMQPLDVIEHRLRRFSGESTTYGMNFMDERLPFYDIDLMKYLVGLPKDYLADGRLYDAMLLQRYGEYFRWIPWQRTGVPISIPLWLQRTSQRCGTIRDRLYSRVLKIKRDRWFHAAPQWLTAEPATTYLRCLLLSDDALFQDHLDKRLTQNKVHDCMGNPGRNAEWLCRLLTFEIWLRMVKSRGTFKLEG